jgi:2-oxoglutarate ferredoxin oxidoreductase subunit gamma
MVEEILVAGFGGQGIMLMGQLLAYGAIYEGLEVTFFPSYGPEMRGGTANCTVVISDGRIGSPVRNKYTVLMAMNQASLDKFGTRVKPGGMVAYNASLIDRYDPPVAIRSLPIPANEVAMELGNHQVANMVAVGGLACALGRISIDSLSSGLRRVLPEYRHHLIPINEKAIHRGMEAVRSAAPMPEAG